MAGSDERRARGTPLDGDREGMENEEGRGRGDVRAVESVS